MGQFEFLSVRFTAIECAAKAGKPYRLFVTLFALLAGLTQFGFSLAMDRVFVRMGITDLANLDLDALTFDGTTVALLIALPVAFFLIVFSLQAALSAYALRAAKEEDVGFSGFLQSLRAVPRALPAAVAVLVALFALFFLINLVGLFSFAAAMIASIGGFVLTVSVLYMYRLYLQTLADRRDLGVIAAARRCRRLTKGCRSRLLLLDLSYLWFFVMLSLVSNAVSSLPLTLSQFGALYGAQPVADWIAANGDALSVALGLASVLLTLPLYYWMYGRICASYALAYQKLDQTPRTDEAHPLAYAVEE